jgi:hypothetical protein
MAHSTVIAAAIVSLTAGAAVAAAEPVAAPAAIVRGHSVINAAEHVIVRVPKTATYVGSDRFDLYGVADAEVHLFVESDAKKRVKKLYWIQFEHYWPSKADMTHDYTSDRRTQQWGTTTWLRGGASSTAGPAKPGSDTQHVRAILERAGYTAPPEVMVLRMVQLLDDPKGTGHGRNELMLIYSEDLALSGKTLAELTTDGKPNANWSPVEGGLVERATEAFLIERK